MSGHDGASDVDHALPVAAGSFHSFTWMNLQSENAKTYNTQQDLVYLSVNQEISRVRTMSKALPKEPKAERWHGHLEVA